MRPGSPRISRRPAECFLARAFALALFTALVMAPRAWSQCALVTDEQSYVVITTDPVPNPIDMTVEAWLRPRNISPSSSQLIRSAVYKRSGYELYLQHDGSSRRFWYRALAVLEDPATGDRESHILSSTATYSGGQWAHVALAFRSSTGRIRLFVDGVQEDIKFVAPGLEMRPRRESTIVGARRSGQNPFSGRIDELRVWKEKRSSAEIGEMMNRSVHRLPTVTGVWHFDQSLEDEIAGNHGLASGNPVTYDAGIVCPGEEFPGSRVDFELLSGVNGPLDAIASKPVVGGDIVTLSLRSPGQAYDGVPVFWLLQFASNASTPQNSMALPQGWLNAGLGFQDLTQGFPLPSTGLSLGPFAYPSLPGIDTWTQALALDLSAPGNVVATNLHRLRQSEPVYVSALGSATGVGTANDPLQSIEEGYALARSRGAALRIAAGVYPDVDVVFDTPIDVTAGLDPTTWTATGSRSTLLTNQRGLRVRGVATAVTIEALEVIASGGVSPARGSDTGPDMASIALDVRNSTSGLRFVNCRFESGPGAQGLRGTNGASRGSNGSDGDRGTNGDLVGTNRPPGGSAGTAGPNNGGRGGSGGWHNRHLPNCTRSDYDGNDGHGGDGRNGSGGGGGRSSLAGEASDGDDGSHGGHGANGDPGEPSSQAPGGWVNDIGDWEPHAVASSGRVGQDGGGGGGGGGGGASILITAAISGGGGGGGGSGGQGGDPGTGGTDGGASIAVYLYAASPTFVGSEFFSSNGGNGGNGGSGRRGGTGGAGAGGGRGQGVQNTGTAASGDGGSGGDGGQGGGGGGGGGGHGGPSWCVVRSNSSVYVDGGNNTFTLGTGGSAGAGGLSGEHHNGVRDQAVSGQPGPASRFRTL